jgi:biopolymer transport protein ExbB/TolQ
MIDTLRNGLYLLSNALLLPTLVLILAVAAWTLILMGGILREWLTRREVRDSFDKALAIVKEENAEGAAALRPLWACKNGIPLLFGKRQPQCPRDRIEREKGLEDLELAITTSLSKLTWITRIGPMLWLMGTLIPLGPALSGLAAGNVVTLSSNLVVAFTTTVIGVFIGCAAFTMSLIRRNWYHRDMSDLEYILQRAGSQAKRPLYYATEEEKMG